MSKQIGIGKATRLARLGEMVNVSINGSTIAAKAAKNLSSTKVLILFDGRTYYAYPHSKTVLPTKKITALAKHEKRNSPKKYDESAVIVYKVRYSNGTGISCTLPYWNYYEGNGCVRVCGLGTYTSQSQCNQANERNNSFDETYSVGYFKRGFLSAFGAPVTDLGFFYPINTDPEHVYCRGGFLQSGEGAMQAINQVIKGDGTYTNRRWIVPPPNYNVLGFSDLLIHKYEHKYYADPLITASLLQQWNSLYNLQFYDYEAANNPEPGRGPYRPPWTGNYELIGSSWDSWESSIARLNPDGTLYVVNVPDRPFPIQQWKSVGLPNWVWRQIDINAILIYDTYYYRGADEGLQTSNDVADITAWKRLNSGDMSFTPILRAQSADSMTLLPPASIVSRTYSAIEEETPVPPGSGWELLWDTRTCPPPPNPPELDLGFDKDYYYVTVNGREPRLLGIFRSDDNVEVLLTNLGNGRYRGALRCGTRVINQIRYFAETRIFDSGDESIDTYSYPSVIPSVQEDWQDFKYRDWRIVPGIPLDTDICLRDRSGPGINVMPTLKTFTQIEIPTDLVTQGSQSLFSVFSYTSLPATETEGERCLVNLLFQDVPIFLPQINTTVSASNVTPLKISIYSNRS